MSVFLPVVLLCQPELGTEWVHSMPMLTDQIMKFCHQRALGVPWVELYTFETTMPCSPTQHLFALEQIRYRLLLLGNGGCCHSQDRWTSPSTPESSLCVFFRMCVLCQVLEWVMVPFNNKHLSAALLFRIWE